MRVLYLLGWIFLVGAFLAAAAETVAHGVAGVEGIFLSAYEVWAALSPKGLVIARYMVERDLSPALWPPLVTVMSLPGWLILGLPGAALVWLCRASGKGEAEDGDEMEESLFLFDALVEEARKEGHLDDLPPDGAGSMEPDYHPDDFPLPTEDEDISVVLTIPPIPEDDDDGEERR